MKLSKTQITKINQLSGSFDFWFANLGKEDLADVAIPLAKDILPGLASNLTSNATNKFERKITGKVAVRTGKRFTLFLLNENMNDIIRIIKS